MRAPTTLIRAITTAALIAGSFPAYAQVEQIVARPLTPYEKDIYELSADLNTSGGLLTVGVGENIYLEAQMPAGTTVNGITWSIVSKPAGSAATLAASPLSADMPIYSVGDREVNMVAGRMLLVPDVVGRYDVEAVVTTAEGSSTLSAQAVAAMYTGVGNLGGASPQYPQCALCHDDQAAKWAGTGHATFFELAIDGKMSSHYGENCIDCHVLGQYPSPMADNNGFDDIANDLGWSFPETLQDGNWAAMPMELKQRASIQCEHCHGAGSLHHGDKTATSVTLSSGDCAQCHDDGHYHVKNTEWDLSRHAVATRYPTGEGRESCVRCHSGIGFIENLRGEVHSPDYEAITCAVCHDPHDPTNAHQVRSIADVTLENDHVVTEGGTGKLCMNCHKSRRNGPEYAEEYHSHYGPHGSPQTDMLVGSNAIDYGRPITSTSHVYALEDACATCHMQETAMDAEYHTLAGGHTFKPVWDAGTPDDHSDDVHLTQSCTQCHGPIDSFDMLTYDHDGNGEVEGVMTEIENLLHSLAMRLPPIGEPTVAVTNEYTPAELKAAYNYLFVEEDGSMGIHNTRYSVNLLKFAIADLDSPINTLVRAENYPLDSDWYYAGWFGYYSMTTDPNWVYHPSMGMLFGSSASTPQSLWFYSTALNQWVYVRQGNFPNVWLSGDAKWGYLALGIPGRVQYIYKQGDADWTSFNVY